MHNEVKYIFTYYTCTYNIVFCLALKNNDYGEFDWDQVSMIRY